MLRILHEKPQGLSYHLFREYMDGKVSSPQIYSAEVKKRVMKGPDSDAWNWDELGKHLAAAQKQKALKFVFWGANEVHNDSLPNDSYDWHTVDRYIAKTSDMIEFYEESIGPLPLERILSDEQFSVFSIDGKLVVIDIGS